MEVRIRKTTPNRKMIRALYNNTKMTAHARSALCIYMPRMVFAIRNEHILVRVSLYAHPRLDMILNTPNESIKLFSYRITNC